MTETPGTEAGPVTAREAARTTNGAGYTRQPEPSGAEAGPVTAWDRLFMEGVTTVDDQWCVPLEVVLQYQPAIEAEARAQRDAELRAAVEGLSAVLWGPEYTNPTVDDALLEVLALLSDHAHADTPSREGGGG